MRRAPSWLLRLIVIVVAGTAVTAPGSASALALAGPPAAQADVTVAEVYRRAGQALARPGLLYHATIQAETDIGGLRGTGTTTQWVDAYRGVAREEMAWRSEQANGPPDTSTTTAILTARARYSTRPPPLPVMATTPPACYGATLAAIAALGCPPDPRFSPSTTTVEAGSYAGGPAVVLVTAATFAGEYPLTLTTRLYLDPATCLPLGAEGDGQIAMADQLPDIRPVRLRSAYAHGFIPVDAVPADFFDPAALGYVPPGDDIARPVPAFPDFRAYWLGERFAGAGDLPPLAPGRVERPLPPGGGPGYQFILNYGRAAEPFGFPLVTMQEFPRTTWDAFLAQSGGHNYWDGPCVTREEIALPDGRATIFSGYAAGPPPVQTGLAPGVPGCPAAPPDTFLAHAYLGQTVLLIYASPAGLPNGTTILSPYNSRAGMALVVGALRPCLPGGARRHR